MTERLSASVAGRILHCPASANLDLAIPGWTPPDVDPNKGAKGLGTKMHALMEQVVTLTAKEMRAMGEAIEYVAALKDGKRWKQLLEEEQHIDWLQGSPRTTADLVLYNATEMHVIDYKFGRIPVDVVDNPQLKFYALAYTGYAPKAKIVTLHVVQPFANNFASWQVSPKVLELYKEELILADQKIHQPDLSFGVSDYCTFCPAYPHTRGDKGSPLCPAAMSVLYPTVIDTNEVMNL